MATALEGNDRYMKDHPISDPTGRIFVSYPSSTKIGESGVFLIIDHSDSATVGMALNKVALLSFPDVLTSLKIRSAKREKTLRAGIMVNVIAGGKTCSERGFVLHSPDLRLEGSVRITNDIYLTATVDMIMKIAKGEGPRSAVLVLGLTQWDQGKFAREIANGLWLECPLDCDLVFNNCV